MKHIAVLAFALSFAQMADGDEKVIPTRKPSPSPERMLSRFVEECVEITPGTNGFPNEAVLGTLKPRENELTRRPVKISHSFRISKYEMTQELYLEVTGKNPSRWTGPRNSVEQVTWNDVHNFCKILTQRLRKQNLISADEQVRLPTATEWEYCCRAGSDTTYCFGDDIADADSPAGLLDQFAWHTGNAAGNDPAVGVLKPNKWGLFDVHGYLWEFVLPDPDGDSNATSEVAKRRHQIRGGSWRDEHTLLSSSTYLLIDDGHRSDAIGFRCVIAPETSNKE